ncbi:MAG: hypothetical protein HY694_09805 [Deltaproteobacteria bacterium]|nr:hypothetical protein [Deltaproteobacteria bacterium]
MSDIASSSGKGSTASTSGNGSLRSRFSLRGVLFSLAALIFVVSTFIAYTQDPRPDPFLPASTFDLFRYPIEYNAFRRLPVVNGTVRAVFAVKGTKHVWAVGDRQLILYSGNGGKSWEQQQISPPKPAVAALAGSRSLQFVPTAWAQSEKSVGEQLKASETLQVDPKASQKPAQQKPLAPSPPQGLGLDTEVSPSTGKPPADLGKLPVELKEAVKPEQRGPTSIRAPPQTKTPPTKSPEKGSGGTGSQPTPATLANLSGLYFVDQLTGWAVGSNGTILHTTDGGLNWNPQTRKTPDWLSSVAFVDAKTGWAVGDRGTILHTSDGGQTWNPQASGSKNPLHSVAFVDAKTGWAVGEQGTILHTSNSGQTWGPQSSKTAAQLHSVTFVDAKTGWAVGEQGTIRATNDGGQTWNPQASGSKNPLHSVAFVDAKRG